MRYYFTKNCQSPKSLRLKGTLVIEEIRQNIEDFSRIGSGRVNGYLLETDDLVVTEVTITEQRDVSSKLRCFRVDLYGEIEGEETEGFEFEMEEFTLGIDNLLKDFPENREIRRAVLSTFGI